MVEGILSSKEHCHGCGKLWSEESPDCIFNYHTKPNFVRTGTVIRETIPKSEYSSIKEKAKKWDMIEQEDPDATIPVIENIQLRERIESLTKEKDNIKQMALALQDKLDAIMDEDNPHDGVCNVVVNKLLSEENAKLKKDNEALNIYSECADEELKKLKIQLKDANHYKTWHDILKLDYKKLEDKADSYLIRLEQKNEALDEIKEWYKQCDFDNPDDAQYFLIEIRPKLRAILQKCGMMNELD